MMDFKFWMGRRGFFNRGEAKVAEGRGAGTTGGLRVGKRRRGVGVLGFAGNLEE